jgi:hypothetical protein
MSTGIVHLHDFPEHDPALKLKETIMIRPVIQRIIDETAVADTETATSFFELGAYMAWKANVLLAGYHATGREIIGLLPDMLRFLEEGDAWLDSLLNAPEAAPFEELIQRARETQYDILAARTSGVTTQGDAVTDVQLNETVKLCNQALCSLSVTYMEVAFASAGIHADILINPTRN